MKWARFFNADTNVGKLNITFIIIRWGMVKIRRGLTDLQTLKSDIYHKLFEELSRLIVLNLHVDSDEILFGLMAILLCII